MKLYYEKTCGGSLELLRTRDLEQLLRYINEGRDYEGLSPEDDYSDTSLPDDDKESEDDDEQ